MLLRLRASLISVARMVDAGYRICFDHVTCYISKAGWESELGTRKVSLYYLNTEKESPLKKGDTLNMASLGLATNQSPLATLETWHWRLGHRTLDTTSVKYIASKVKDMRVENENISLTKICAVCTL